MCYSSRAEIDRYIRRCSYAQSREVVFQTLIDILFIQHKIGAEELIPIVTNYTDNSIKWV